MKRRTSLVCSAILALTTLAGSSPASAQAVAESKLPQSSVSVLVEPQLNDGRLVIRLAAKNLGASPVTFGPSSVSIAKPGGETVAVMPLAILIDDVRVAGGLPVTTAPAMAPTQGAYAAPQQNIRDGRVDVSGFTGGSAVGGDEYIRQNQSRSKSKTRPTISAAEAEAQIAALKQGILQDSTLAPGKIAAGQVVTEQLKFGKKEDRTLHLRVRVANEEHSFTLAAPEK